MDGRQSLPGRGAIGGLFGGGRQIIEPLAVGIPALKILAFVPLAAGLPLLRHCLP
jgi:hypothetical protein